MRWKHFLFLSLPAVQICSETFYSLCFKVAQAQTGWRAFITGLFKSFHEHKIRFSSGLWLGRCNTWVCFGAFFWLSQRIASCHNMQAPPSSRGVSQWSAQYISGVKLHKVLLSLSQSIFIGQWQIGVVEFLTLHVEGWFWSHVTLHGHRIVNHVNEHCFSSPFFSQWNKKSRMAEIAV